MTGSSGRRERTLDQTLRMRQTAMLALQLRPLFNRQIEGVHFTHLPLELLALSGNRGSVALQRLQMPPQILPTAPGRSHRGKQIAVTTIGVKQLALRHRPHQILVLMLAMDINQIFSGTAQLRQRRSTAIDKCTRTASGINYPPEQAPTIITGQLLLGQPPLQR